MILHIDASRKAPKGESDWHFGARPRLHIVWERSYLTVQIASLFLRVGVQRANKPRSDHH